MPKLTDARPANRIVALFPELLGIGGVQLAGRLTAAALSQIASKHGFAVDFLSLNDPADAGTFSCAGKTVSFRGFGRAKGRFAFAALAGSRRQARIVVAVHPNLAVVAAQMKVAQRHLKVAVISHGVEVWRLLPTLRRKAFLKAELFLAPSRYTIDQIVRVQGAPEAKTRLLHWPLDPSVLEIAKIQEALPLPPAYPEGLVVLATARLAKGEGYKGVDQLITAVARVASKVPSLHLVVVASGDDIPRHQELAREAGVSSRVTFFQGLSSAEVGACYSRCDIFALPSTGEGFGFVFLEAMAFGKPVLGAAIGGVTEIVEHGKNGVLVRPGDLTELAENLEGLLASRQFRCALGARGAEMVRSRFQFEAFQSKLEEILTEE